MHEAIAVPPDFIDPITLEDVYRDTRLVQLLFPVPRGRRTRSTLLMVRRMSLFHIPAPFSEPCGKHVAGCKCTPLRADAMEGAERVVSAVEQETPR